MSVTSSASYTSRIARRRPFSPGSRAWFSENNPDEVLCLPNPTASVVGLANVEAELRSAARAPTAPARFRRWRRLGCASVMFRKSFLRQRAPRRLASRQQSSEDAEPNIILSAMLGLKASLSCPVKKQFQGVALCQQRHTPTRGSLPHIHQLTDTNPHLAEEKDKPLCQPDTRS